MPFYIRTGKNKTRASEIVITFKGRPHDIFTGWYYLSGSRIPNRLIIGVQPMKGLGAVDIEEPGPGGMRLFPELNLVFGRQRTSAGGL